MVGTEQGHSIRECQDFNLSNHCHMIQRGTLQTQSSSPSDLNAGFLPSCRAELREATQTETTGGLNELARFGRDQVVRQPKAIQKRLSTALQSASLNLRANRDTNGKAGTRNLAAMLQLCFCFLVVQTSCAQSVSATVLESYWSSESVVFSNLVNNSGGGSMFQTVVMGGSSLFLGQPSVDQNGTLTLPLTDERVGGQARLSVSLMLCSSGNETANGTDAGNLTNRNSSVNSTAMDGWNQTDNSSGAWNATANASGIDDGDLCMPRVALNTTFTISIYVGSVDFVVQADEQENLTSSIVQQNLSAFLGVDSSSLEVTDLLQPVNASRRLLATAVALQVRVKVFAGGAARGVLDALNETRLSAFIGRAVTLSNASATFRDAAGSTALLLSVQSSVLRDDAGVVSLPAIVSQVVAPELPIGPDGAPDYDLVVRVSQYRQSSSTGPLGPWQTGEPSSLIAQANGSCSVCVVGGNLTFSVLVGAAGEVVVELSLFNRSAIAFVILTILPTSVAPSFALPELRTIPEDADYSFSIQNLSRGGWRLAPELPIRFEYVTRGIDTIQSVLFSDNCTMPGTQSCEAVIRPYPMRFGNTTVTITLFNDGATYTPYAADNYSASVSITVTHENVVPTFTLKSEVVRVEEDAACVLRASAAGSLTQPTCNTSIPLYHRYESYADVLLGMFEEQTPDACSPSGWTSAPGACLAQRGTFTVVMVSGDSFIFSSAPTMSPDGTLEFSLSQHRNGQATFNVTLTDDGITNDAEPTPKSSSKLLTIFIFPINDPPTFQLMDSISSIEGSGTSSEVVIFNTTTGPFESSQSITFTVAPGPGAANMFSAYSVIGGNTLEFTLRPASFGEAYLYFTATDDGGNARGGVDTSEQKVLYIRVWPINNPPSFVIPNPVVRVDESASEEVVIPGFVTNISAGSPNEDCEVETVACERQSVTFFVDHVERDFLFASFPAITHTGTLSFSVQPSVSGATRVFVRLEDDAGTNDTSVRRHFDVIVQSIEHVPSFALRREVSCLTLESRSFDACTCPPTTEPQSSLDACGRSPPGVLSSISVLKDAGSVLVEAFATHITNADGYVHASMTIFTVDNTTGRLRFQERRQDPVWGTRGLEYATDLITSPEQNQVYALEYDLDALLVFEQNGTDLQFFDRRESIERRLRFVGFNDADRFDRTPLELSTPALRSLTLLEAAGKQFVFAAAGADEPAKDVERRRRPPPVQGFPFLPEDLWAVTTAMWIFSPEEVFAPVSTAAEEVAARFYVEQFKFPVSNQDDIWNRTINVSCAEQGCSVTRGVNTIDTDSCLGLQCDECSEMYDTFVHAASIRDYTGKTGPLVLTGPACKWKPSLNFSDWDVPDRQLDVRTFLMSNEEVGAMQFDGSLNPGMYLTLDINKIVTGDPATTLLPTGNFSVEVWFTIDADPEPASLGVLDQTLRGLLGTEAYRRFPFCGRGWALGYRQSEAGTSLEFHIFTEGTEGSEYQLVYTTTTPLRKGAWQHLVAVYEEPRAKLYLNGVLVLDEQACSSGQCGRPVYPARTGLPSVCDDKPYNFSVGVFFNGMDEMLQPRSGDPVSPHIGAIHLVRIYEVPLDETMVGAQYNDRAGRMARNPLETTFWTASTVQGREAPQFDFVDMATSSDLVVRGNLDLTKTYRCEWQTEVEGEEKVSIGKVSFDSEFGTHVLECHTPLWPYGVRVSTMRISEWKESAGEWKAVWMKVCIDEACGFANTPEGRERWYFGTDTVRNGTRSFTLRNNVDGMPFRFRFVSASSILQLEVEEEVGGGAVESLVIVSAGVNYVDGELISEAVGEGRLLSGRFTVDTSGGIVSTTIDVRGMAYPSEGGQVVLIDELGHRMTNSITAVNLSSAGAGFMAGSWEILGAEGSNAKGTFNVTDTGSDADSVGTVFDLQITQGGLNYLTDPVEADLQFYFQGTRTTQEGAITRVLGENGFLSGLTSDVPCFANCSSSTCTGSGFEGTCVSGGVGLLARVDVIAAGAGYDRNSPPDMFCIVNGEAIAPGGISLVPLIPKRPSVSIFRASGADIRYETRTRGLQDLSIFGLPRGGFWNAVSNTSAAANSTAETGMRPLWEGATSFTPFTLDNTSYFLHANWWDGVVGNKWVVSNSGRLLSQPKSYLYSWDPYAGTMACIQAVRTSGATEWVQFTNGVGHFVAVANYQQVLPDGETTTRAWSRIYRFGNTSQENAPSNSEEACNSRSAHGFAPVDESSVTEIATMGATGLESFVMNHSSRLSLIQYLVVSNYYDSETDAGNVPSKLYMLGSPVSASQSIFGISSTVTWKTCSDTGASCSTDSDCFVHTCDDRCVVSRRGDVIDRVCRCSNNVNQFCRQDPECYTGLTCSYGGVNIVPEDHASCFAGGNVRFVGSDYQHLVTACEVQTFHVERASDVAHWQQGSRHFLVFASDSQNPTEVFFSEDGAQPFAPLQSVASRLTSSVKFFYSPMADHLYLILTQGQDTRSLITRWNGTSFVLDHRVAVPGGQSGLHVIHRGEEYGVVGGSTNGVAGSTMLFRAYDDTLPSLDGPNSVVISPSGSHVYVASLASQTILCFLRQEEEGTLAYLFSTSLASLGPLSVPGIKQRAEDYGSPVRGILDMIVSADGHNVYLAASQDNAIHTFVRNESSGELQYLSSVTDPDRSKMMQGPRQLVATADGTRVYAVCRYSQSIVALDRSLADGSLSYRDTIVNGERRVVSLEAEVRPGSEEYPLQLGAAQSATWRDSVRAAKAFRVGGHRFLALAASDDVEDPRGIAVVLVWNETALRFDPFQELPREDSAADVEAFEVTNLDGIRFTYLAVANAGGATRVYVFDGSIGRFVLHHTVPGVPLPYNLTTGCGCLCSQPNACGACFSDLFTSFPQCPSGEAGCSFSSVGLSPRRIRHFSISQTGEHFLAVANYHALGTKCSDAYSVVYRWNGDAPRSAQGQSVWGFGFEPFQAFPTRGALDVDFIAVETASGPRNLLFIANFAQGMAGEAMVWEHKPYLYNHMIQARAGRFELLQSIPAQGVSSVHALSIDDDGYFLAIGNRQTAPFDASILVYNVSPELLKWNGTMFTWYQTLSGQTVPDATSYFPDPPASPNVSAVPGAPTWVSLGVLAGVSSFRHFQDLDGEHYLVLALSFCDPGTNRTACQAVVSQPQSAILQWDRTNRSFGEMLAWADSLYEEVHGEPVHEEIRRYHEAALRMPVGRGLRFEAFDVGDQVMLVACSLDKGATAIPFIFDTSPGFGGAITLAVDADHRYLYTASEDEQSVVVFGLSDSFDSIGNPVSIFEHVQSLSQLPLHGRVDPVPEGLRGVRSVSVEEQDCTGYVVDGVVIGAELPSPDPNTTARVQSTKCTVAVVRGSVPRNQMPCSDHTTDPVIVDPLEPPLECREQTFNTSMVSTTNPGLFAVEPYLVSMGPLMGALNFSLNAGQSGTARFRAQLFKSPVGNPSFSPLSQESDVLAFDINVVDINDAPTFVLKDVQFVMDGGEQEAVFAFNITAEGLGLDNYTWEWAYVCPINTTTSNNTANCSNGTAPDSYSPSIFVRDPRFRFEETPDGLVGIVSVDVVPLLHDVIRITVRMNDGSEPDPDTGSLHTSETVLLTITVLPINHAPTFVPSPPRLEMVEGEEQAVPGFVTQLENGPEAENRSQQIFFAVDYVEDVNVFGWNTSTIFEEFSVIGSTLRFRLHPDFNGEIIVYIRISDDGGTDLGGVDRSSVPLHLLVLPVNDAPVLEGNGRAHFACRTTVLAPETVSWDQARLSQQQAAENIECGFALGSGSIRRPTLCGYSQVENAREAWLQDPFALNGQGPDTVDWQLTNIWDPILVGPSGGQEGFEDWYVGLYPYDLPGNPRVPGDFAFLRSSRMPWVTESVTLTQTPGIDVTEFRVERIQDATISFYFVMYGSTVGTLSVSFRYGGGAWFTVPRMTVNNVDLSLPFQPTSFTSRDNWLRAEFALSEQHVQGRDVEIRFEAVRGNGDFDSTSIDTIAMTSDVAVHVDVERCTIEFNITGVLIDAIREVPGAFVVDQPVDEAVVETTFFVARVLSGSDLFFDDPSITPDGTLVLPLAKAGRGVADFEVTVFDSAGLNTTYPVRVIVDDFEELPPFVLRPEIQVVDGDGPKSEPEFAVVTSLEEVPDSAQEFIQFTVVCTTTAPGMFEQLPALDSVGTLTWEIREGFSGRVQCSVILQAQEAGIEDTPPQSFSMRVWPRPQVHSVQPAVLPARKPGSVVTVRGRNFGSLRSRGYSAESYGDVTVMMTGALTGVSSAWTPCVSTTYVGDSELLCEVPPGEGERHLKVEILDGVNRTGVLSGAVLSVEMWFVGVAEDQHCASVGMPWPHRQEAITQCGSRGFIGFSPLSPGQQEIGEAMVNVSSSVRSVGVMGGRLYVGGGFATVNALRVNHIVAWDGKDLTPLELGLDGSVAAMQPFVDPHGTEKLVVAGSFTRAYTATGAVATGGVALWDGVRWEAAGGASLHGVALCLGVRGSNVLAGGKFTAVGDVKATNVALFNGSSWSALGDGVVGEVYACAVSAAVMYVGGKVAMAGGEEVENVAGWNGKSWGALLDGECLHQKRSVCGISGRVLAMATVGEYLYVGGMFDMAGGKPANNVARFYSGVWEPLGMGVDGPVTVMSALKVAGSVSGSCVYIAGEFRTATDLTGDTEVGGLARWCVGDPVLVRAVENQVVSEFWQAVAVPEGVRGIRTMGVHPQ